MAIDERIIFEAALEIADLRARQNFLERACAGDADLRARVDALLNSHDNAGSFLDVPAMDQMGQGSPPFIPNTINGTSGGVDDGDDGWTDLNFLQPSSRSGSIGTLGHYEILQVLGKGAFGIVFKAFDEKLHRHVAIKAMNPQLAATSPPRKRFLREARSVAAIKHENIVQVYSVEEQPLPYLVMEFIDGQTLQQKLNQAGPLDVTEILYLGRQMACGLAAAHEKNLIHRDIKPGNILLEVGTEQKVKITDFGLARAADDATMTRTGTIAGTPMYMSPEQAMGKPLDHRSDLFSLGSVLYQMASGRPPFRGASALAVLKRVTDEAPRPIQEILPDVPTWLCDIISRLQAKNPDERFQTAQEVADLFARLHRETQLGVHPSQPSPLTAESLDVAREPREISPPGARGKNADPRNSHLGSMRATITRRALITACIAAAAIVAVFVLNRDRNKDVTSGERPSSERVHKDAKASGSGWYGWSANAPPPAIAPFNTEQARQHQEAWAAYLNVPIEYTNSIGITFRLIPPGEFQMGSSRQAIAEALPIADDDVLWQDCIRSEGPEHWVVLTQPVYISVCEVTQSQYQHIMASNPSHFAASGEWAAYVSGLDTSHFPVEGVSWDKAIEFCRRLTERESLASSQNANYEPRDMLTAGGYRLPSEAEWEFACRAGTITQYSSGETPEDLTRVGWYTSISGDRTHAVGKLQSNPFGLFDMHGNVWEWALDAWDPHWYSTLTGNPAVNPFNPPGANSERMSRGGNYISGAFACRSASRCSEASSYNASRIGFRVTLPVGAVRMSRQLTGPAISERQVMKLRVSEPASDTTPRLTSRVSN